MVVEEVFIGGVGEKLALIEIFQDFDDFFHDLSSDKFSAEHAVVDLGDWG